LTSNKGRLESPPCRAHAGFSFVEVMIAILVSSIGLMGLAKMQALAFASSSTAKLGALAAIEAASLAATMHADRAYWSGITANLTVAVGADGKITANDGALKAPTSKCNSPAAVCTSAQIAALDVSEWATGLAGTLSFAPATPATVVCLYDAARQNPVSCTIVIASGQTTYMTYVDP